MVNSEGLDSIDRVAKRKRSVKEDERHCEDQAFHELIKTIGTRGGGRRGEGGVFTYRRKPFGLTAYSSSGALDARL